MLCVKVKGAQHRSTSHWLHPTQTCCTSTGLHLAGFIPHRPAVPAQVYISLASSHTDLLYQHRSTSRWLHPTQTCCTSTGLHLTGFIPHRPAVPVQVYISLASSHTDLLYQYRSTSHWLHPTQTCCTSTGLDGQHDNSNTNNAT